MVNFGPGNAVTGGDGGELAFDVDVVAPVSPPEFEADGATEVTVAISGVSFPIEDVGFAATEGNSPGIGNAAMLGILRTLYFREGFSIAQTAGKKNEKIRQLLRILSILEKIICKSLFVSSRLLKIIYT